MTSLNDLLAKAKPVPVSLVKRNITWKQVDPDTNDEIDHTATVFVVPRSSLTFASTERIYSGDAENRVARLIVERIRLGEQGEEQFTEDQLSEINPSLGLALFSAATDYDKSEDEARKAKKDKEAAEAPAAKE